MDKIYLSIRTNHLSKYGPYNEVFSENAIRFTDETWGQIEDFDNIEVRILLEDTKEWVLDTIPRSHLEIRERKSSTKTYNPYLN